MMFNLANYEPTVRAYMQAYNTTPKVATDNFVYNLIVMRDMLPGFDEEVNFRVLGQQWNGLMSDTRIAQKRAMIAALERNSYEPHKAKNSKVAQDWNK